MRGLVVVIVIAWSSHAAAQRWTDATARCVGTTAQWSNEVDVADLDGDGNVDILVANGGNYDTPGPNEATRVWRNLGDWSQQTVRCSEISAEAVGSFTGLSRTIRAVDVDKDGDLDILNGGAYQSQLRLYLKDGAQWGDASSRLPQQATAIHDIEPGDVDGDGDLDLLISDTGAQNPTVNAPGGRTKLYLNDGAGNFTDATTTNMPDILVKWSWDVELVDIDNDWDLDALISCKRCTTSYIFRNDGTGKFVDDPNALPHFGNNYEFEAMDIDHDGDLDLATLNDGAQLRDHLFINDGTGKFADETATRLAGTANPATDDNAVVWLDADADGDADLFVASLNGADRLLLNNGSGVFALAAGPTTPNDTPGSLSVAFADLDGDGRLDLVQAQGEAAFPEKVQLASQMIAVDSVAPRIDRVMAMNGFVYARAHDHFSPVRAHDWQRVWVESNGTETTMTWYGEYLWRAQVTPGATFRVCAKDRRGNQACSDMGVGGDDMPPHGDGGIDPVDKSGGGCCDANGAKTNAAFALVLFVLIRRRRR